MRPRDFDSFFGDKAQSAPTYDMSSFTSRVSSIPHTNWDGPPGGSTPGSLDGTPGGEGFTVHLTAGVTYSFAERPTDTGGIVDPFLYLADSTGNTLLTYDDDGGAGRSSLLSYTPTVTGDYTLFASSWVNDYSTGGDVGNFNLFQWDNTQPDAGDTAATAVSITTGTTFGQVASGTDVDMYKIDLTAGQYYTFGYSGGYDGAGETGNIGRLQLLDSNGNVVSSGLAAESGMNLFAQTSGTYYVKVTPYTAAGTAHGGYTLDVTGVDPATKDPLDAIRWKSANNIQTHDVGGVQTATVYFGKAGESFGQFEDDGVTPMITYGWTPAQHDALLNMLNTTYTPITGIHYVETTDSSTATFRVLTDHSALYGAYFDPQDPAYGPDQGVGVFNLLSGGFGADPNSLLQGGFSYAVMAHEFGHAHGLAHPHDNGGGSDVLLGVNGSTGAGSYGIYDLNQGVYTVMSYNDGYPLDPDGNRGYSAANRDSGWSGSLGAFDIAALQERYGVHDYNTGNNTYTISDDQAHAFYQTIWDTGGTDTIAYSGARDAQIDLTAATLDYSPTGGGVVSIAHGIFGGYTIAHGVVIENATGGSGNDVLIGNSADNVLTGNAGNDVLIGRGGDDQLIGGAGHDTFVFQGTNQGNDVIRDFQAGQDKIDLSAYADLTASGIKIKGNNLFADTDHNGSYDLHMTVLGSAVHTSDIIFHS